MENPDPRPHIDDTAALIREAKAGDESALNRLFAHYYPRVIQIARLRLGPSLRSKLESRDIAQDAFLRAVAGFEKFELRREGAFLHWLGELVRNAINDRHDQFSAKKRDSRQEVPLERRDSADATAELSLPGPDPTPSRDLVGKQEFLRLAAALDRLEPDARDAIVFRDLEGLSFSEIGELTGRSEDAARMHYSRAKARLAAEFDA